MRPSITFQTISYRNQKMETKSKEKAGKLLSTGAHAGLLKMKRNILELSASVWRKSVWC